MRTHSKRPDNDKTSPQHADTMSNKHTSDDYYRLGNDLRRRGDYPAAINAYLEAIALDPDSPAVHAKQMLDDIMNYYHKDAYNP